MKRSRWLGERGAVALIFLWFLFQALYFSVQLYEGIGPDEKYHVESATFYYKLSGFDLTAERVPPKYGPLTREPYLYHLLMGKLLHLKPAEVSSLMFMRVVSVALSGAGFLAMAWFLFRLRLSPPTRLLVLLLLASTLMFTFLAGMANYDNLVHPMMYLCFALLAGLYQRFTLQRLLVFLVVMLLGSLTKVSFLPLICVFVPTLVFLGRHQWKRREFWLGDLRGWRVPSLLAVLVVVSALNGSLYIGNLFHYGGIRASCEAIYTEEACVKKYYFSRRYVETVEKTKDWERWSFWQFQNEYWREVKVQLFGVIGAKQVRIHDRADRLPYRIVFGAFVLSLLAAAWRGRDLFRDPRWLWCLGTTVFVGYFFAVHNYLYYRRIGQFGLALQARYLFPVLPLAYVVFCQPIFHTVPRKATWWVFGALAATMIFGGFWIFHTVVVTPEWYR